MAYTPPTPADLKAMFPAFASVANTTVQIYLDRAARMVDESWLEGDFATGRILLAAHYMVTAGITGTDEIAGYGAAGVSRLKSGTLDVSFKDDAGGGIDYGAYGSTSYGRQFYTLLKQNKGGPRVIVGRGGCYSGWAKDWPVGTGGH